MNFLKLMAKTIGADFIVSIYWWVVIDFEANPVDFSSVQAQLPRCYVSRTFGVFQNDVRRFWIAMEVEFSRYRYVTNTFRVSAHNVQLF